MQTRFPDASWRFRSLDDVYYYGGQNGHVMIALVDHTPLKNTEEIELRKGDHISLAGNHWNGLSKGKNHRTNQIGLFPSFKVKDILQVY
jgi:glycoprotein 6-alpha-L-fucosyltransferase